MYLAVLLSSTLSACGSQNIVIIEGPESDNKGPVTRAVDVQLQAVIKDNEACEKKGYKLVNEELSGNSKICYYLKKRGATNVHKKH